MTGGAKGVLLKSKVPNKKTYAKSLGLSVDDLNKFKVISFCLSNLSHCAIENYGSTPDKQAIK